MLVNIRKGLISLQIRFSCTYTLGFFKDIIDGLNALANLKKADAEQIKAKTQKDKMKELKKQNKELKKDRSRSYLIGIIGIIVTIVFGFLFYYLTVYLPTHNST